MMNDLFVGSGATDTLERLRIEGYDEPVPGTVYAENRLEWGGAPLGALGTGYITFDTDGRLGKWQIFNNYPKPMQQDATWLEIEVGGRQHIVAYPKDGIGDATSVRYCGRYPIVDASFSLAAPLRVQVRAYSCFLPGDALASNTPGIVFDIRVTNTDSNPVDFRLTFGPEKMPAGQQQRFTYQGWNGVTVSHRWLFGSSVASTLGVERAGLHTYTLAGEGADSASSPEHAALSAQGTAKPGETVRQKFVLSWHQPNMKDASNKYERHTYALRFADAAAVARSVIDKHEEWLHRIIAWQSVIYTWPDYPDWLKEALVNGLYNLTKNSVWLAKERPDHHFAADGAFVQNESFSTCPLTETAPCHWFGHWPILFFFPELEYTTLHLRRYFQLADGQIPFALAQTHGTRIPVYFCQHTSGQGEYAQTLYRYFLRTGDQAFLTAWYPSLRGALRFSEWLDYDGDGLVNEHPHNGPGATFPANNPFDQWPWYGTSSYTASKWLATLEMGIAAAEQVGDMEVAAHWRRLLELGCRSFEQKLWNGAYYRLFEDPEHGQRSETCLSAQLNGVFAARVLGLDNPLPAARIHAALDATTRLNQAASPFGMMNGVQPDGAPDPWPLHAQSCFTGPNFVCAMTYIYMGRADEGLAVAEKIINTLFRGPHAMPWGQPCAIDCATGDVHHGHDYHDALALWAMPLALAGHDVGQGVQPGTLVDHVLHAAGHMHPYKEVIHEQAP